MQELSETVEMITLDKEMAEERAETLQIELGKDFVVVNFLFFTLWFLTLLQIRKVLTYAWEFGIPQGSQCTCIGYAKHFEMLRRLMKRSCQERCFQE